MRHMKYSSLPLLAVTLNEIFSPFLPWPVTPESPGRSTFGGVAWPTPFSRYWNFGGASVFGSAPWAWKSLLQIAQWLKTWLGVRGRSFFLTIVKVCGPSPAALLTTVIVPPDFTL